MPITEHVKFNIPTNSEDTEGMTIAALVMPSRDDTLHGFITLPSTVDVENVPILIIALQAALCDLEDNCHNHPTQPMISPGQKSDV